jgi:hypothetical protein
MNGTINLGRSEIEELTAEQLELVTGGPSIITRLLLIWEGIRTSPSTAPMIPVWMMVANSRIERNGSAFAK